MPAAAGKLSNGRAIQRLQLRVLELAAESACGDNVAHRASQLCCLVGLHDDATEPQVFVAAKRGVRRIAAGDDRSHHRIDLDQRFERFFPADPTGQRQIEDDEIETLSTDQRFAVKLDPL